MPKEYIEREAFVYHLENCIDEVKNTNGITEDFEICLKALKVQPAADVEEVVRCEKCKYFFDECCNHEKNRVTYRVPGFGKHYSYVGRIKVEPNHFCGHGERKEGCNNV